MNTLHPAQSVERWTLSRIRSSTSTLFRDATYIWEPERRTPFVSDAILHARLSITILFISECLLHLIIRHYARSQTLVHRHHRVKFIGNWVTTYPDDYRRIVLFWRRIDWTRGCEEHRARYVKDFFFFFFLNSTFFKIFYLRVFLKR